MNVYCDNVKIRHHQCGADCRLKLRGIFDLFQDAAAEHADILGCGMKALLDHNTLWVLSRQKVIIDRIPEVGEKLKVETYPRGTDKLLALREYRIYDESNVCIIHGTAAWLVLDADTLRPLRLSGKILDIIPDNSTLPISFEKLAKLTGNTPEKELFKYQVHSGGIDMNRHLNNATYPELVQDALHSYGMSASDISCIELNYLHACQIGEEITVSAEISGNRAVICGNTPDSAVFRAECLLNATQE